MLFAMLSLFIISSLWISSNAKAYDFVDINTDFDIDYVDSANEVIEMQLFYEAHCPYCVKFETGDFKKVILKLGPHVNIKTYPYGNAITLIVNGKVTITCQHGEEECYGNKLHACTLDLATNHTEALLYNICMTEGGSNDKAADACAASMSMDSKAIKECAKSDKGLELLKHYGEETNKIVPKNGGVPWILVNGNVYDSDINIDFFTFLCKLYKTPPSGCSS